MPRSSLQEIGNIINDPEFESGLRMLTQLGATVMPELNRSSRMHAQEGGSLKQKVEQRCQFAHMGFMMASITGSGLGVKGTATLQRPPIENGIMWCMKRLRKIIVEDYKRAGTRPEYSALPGLLRRVRHLIRVFYDFKVGKRRTPDLKYCDFNQIFDVAIELHQLGLYLQLDPPRLRAAMTGGGVELERFILDDPLDVGPYREEAIELEKRVERDEEADDDERWNASEVEERASEDLAAHVMIWFFADVHVAFLLNKPANAKEREWADKATGRLVQWSTSEVMRDVLGDPLTDSMRPIYWDREVLVRFSKAGGLAALFGDWASSSMREACEDILKKLPTAAWDDQTKKSLKEVARQLQVKLEHEGSDIVTHSVFVDALYNVYKRYGVSALRAASKLEKYRIPVLFYYLQHRIRTEGIVLNTKSDWIRLLKAYQEIPRSTERRYSWGNLSLASKWACIEFYGCNFSECPEMKSLCRLREKRVRGVRDAEVEARLDRWGSKTRACSACLGAAYCSAECQKADWMRHKPECQEAKRNRGERSN